MVYLEDEMLKLLADTYKTRWAASERASEMFLDVAAMLTMALSMAKAAREYNRADERIGG
jgi:hypothetical protein